MLVKRWIFENFNVSVVDKSFVGVLDVKFSCRTSEYVLVVFSCYLPSENLTRGHDAHTCFAQTVYSQSV
jgi:hypothetical protein